MNFLKNAKKIIERYSLAVCGSIFGEQYFLLIFIPFYWFNQKEFLIKSKFSSGFASLERGKKNKLSE